MWSNLRYFPSIFERAEEDHKHFGQDSRFPGRNSTRAPVEYKPEALLLEPMKENFSALRKEHTDRHLNLNDINNDAYETGNVQTKGT